MQEQTPERSQRVAAKWLRQYEATTQAAKEIIEREAAQREAKTARLRAARLARQVGRIGRVPEG